MNDDQIREALIRKVLSKYLANPNNYLKEELGLRHGSNRIDIVLIGEKLHGFEIKSDRDNLQRLTEQSLIYSKIFDKMTLIVGYKHAYNALKMIPEWWGVKLVHKGPKGGIYFSTARLSKYNPSPSKEEIVRLLWKDEALEFIKRKGITIASDIRTKNKIYSKIVEISTLDEIRDAAIKSLIRRLNS